MQRFIIVASAILLAFIFVVNASPVPADGIPFEKDLLALIVS
jgi:hypothetical protein